MSPHITRLEKWIAPRALPLLAVISVLVLAGGAGAYLIVAQNFERVDRLERVILCQRSRECREFVERAIREILRGQRRASKDQGAEHQGVTFRLPSESRGRRGQAPPLVVEIPDAEGDNTPGHFPGQNSPQNHSKPHGEPETGPPEKDNSADTNSPVERRPRQAPDPTQPAVTSPPQPSEEEADSKLPPLATAIEAVEAAEEAICTAIQEVHKLC